MSFPTYPVPAPDEVSVRVIWTGDATGERVAVAPPVVEVTAPSWPVPVYVPVVASSSFRWVALGELPSWTGVAAYPLEYHARSVAAAAVAVESWVRSAVAFAADAT